MDENLIAELVKTGLSGKPGKPGNPKDVGIWVRDEFKYVYCGEYLLKDRIRMISAQIDHVLPKSKYKEFTDLPDNRVLSCFCCNQIKRKFDPLAETPDIKSKLSTGTFKEYRQRLIKVCWNYIKPLLGKKDEILKQSISIIKKYDEIG